MRPTLRGKHASVLGVLLAGLCAAPPHASANPAIDRLFEQCARNLQRSADEIGIRCQHYLRFAEDDDSTRRRQVQAYLTRAQQQGSAAQGWIPAATPWRHRPEDEAVLVPDLLRREGPYRVDVVRTYGSAWEAALLRRAEAIYPEKRRTYCDERPAGAQAGVPPDWACGVIGPLRHAGVASAGALQYYLDWTSAASDPSKPVHESVRFEKSGLVYLAGIRYRDRVQIGKQTFRRVYVAEVNLGWNMTPQGAKPTGFMLNKVVVFNGDGSVAALFDDHPINGVMSES
jgi:hypothetical protein